MIDLRSAVVTVISRCLAVAPGEDVLVTVDQRGGRTIVRVKAGLREG